MIRINKTNTMEIISCSCAFGNSFVVTLLNFTVAAECNYGIFSHLQLRYRAIIMLISLLVSGIVLYFTARLVIK